MNGGPGSGHCTGVGLAGPVTAGSTTSRTPFRLRSKNGRIAQTGSAFSIGRPAGSIVGSDPRAVRPTMHGDPGGPTDGSWNSSGSWAATIPSPLCPGPSRSSNGSSLQKKFYG